MTTIPVGVEDPKALIGKWIRNPETGELYKITDVGNEGVTAFMADEMGGKTYGPPHLISWRLVQAKYNILIQREELQ